MRLGNKPTRQVKKKGSQLKKLSNPFSTGGGGIHFEENVQASFLVLMLTGGNISCFPGRIVKIRLQGKVDGYNIDDLIVFIESNDNGGPRRILGQIKHTVSFTDSNKVFGEVISAAWKDFNNPTTFIKGRDSITLITESSKASVDVRRILDIARSAADVKDFLNKTEKAKFFGIKNQRKLKSFRDQLKKANNNTDISDEQFFDFLKHFYLLGSDLDSPSSTNLSLILSHIGQISQENAQSLWALLVKEISDANQNAGVITIDSLSDEIKNLFRKKPTETVPPELIEPPLLPGKIDWSRDQNAQALAIANLVGSWNENSDSDKEVISLLWKDGYDDWIAKLRILFQKDGSPLSFKNGIWVVSDRLNLWLSLGSWIFDEHLEALGKVAVKVLKERDLQFDLKPEERFMAGSKKKVLTQSRNIRKGIAEGLSLLGSRPEALTNFTNEKPKVIARHVVKKTLAGVEWSIWGSLNDLLPLLAESSPDEFLSVVEIALKQSPSPFDELLAQERSGFSGRTYITGLLWALETLAWDERYLVPVTIILGTLASKDPGGNWANRPSRSLTTIFLPWLPQTKAPIEKRKIALQTLRKEVPDVAWKLLISLLPNQTTASSYSYKPKWKDGFEGDQPVKVPNAEYWKLSNFCANLTVEMAKERFERLVELISFLDHLTRPAFDEFLKLLQSDEINGKTEDEKSILWKQLMTFIARHKRFNDAKWALPADVVTNLESIAKSLEPTDLLEKNQRLFDTKNFDYFDEKKSYKEQEKELQEKRQKALLEIWGQGGIESIIRFVEMVESPYNIGLSFGMAGNDSTDLAVIPKFLDADSKSIGQFVDGYVKGRYWIQKWTWVDKIVEESWTNTQKLKFLIYLFFMPETWKRVRKLLGDKEIDYWKNAPANIFQASGDFTTAIDGLLEAGRPLAAIYCINKTIHDGQPLDKSRAVKTLLAGVSSKEPVSSITSYEVEEVIKALQDDPSTDKTDLFKVEWAYLEMLDSLSSRVKPITVEQRLSEDPNLFCKLIRFMFFSKKQPRIKKEYSESEKALANNAFTLLERWRIIPGMKPDGSFVAENFKMWIDSVVKSCTESGHLEVALIRIGHALIHSPQDPSGLWIHKEVASVLDDQNYDEMRLGFRTALFNARGAHFVDTNGKADNDLAENYRKKANDVENAGFPCLASILRDLADEYDSEAKRIVDKHKRRMDNV